MRTLAKSIKFIGLILLLVACATGGRKDRNELRALIQKKQFDKAKGLIDKSKFYKDKKSHLLAFMEKGMIEHLAGNYVKSNDWLNKAKTLSEKLYTKSISAKVKAAVTNDNYDLYYGEVYERSTIFLYLALNHYLIYQKGTVAGDKPGDPEKKLTINERNKMLYAARAAILGWDSFLDSNKHDRLGKNIFKNDLMAKMLGGAIHEAIGKSADVEIALQLYKDAKSLLFKNYNNYGVFNSKSKDFRKNFSKLHKMKLKDVEKKFTQKTSYYNGLRDFLDEKILTLTKLYRPRQFKKTARRLKAKKSIVTAAKKVKSLPRLKVLVQTGFIPRKVPVKHYYGLLEGLSGVKGKNAQALAKIGHAVLTVFAAQTLGLTSGSPGKAYAGMQVASVASATAAIGFELPMVEQYKVNKKYTLKVLDEKSKVVLTKEIPLVNPMGDIASEAVREHSAWLYTRLGTRLVTKHAVAILAAYATYKLLEPKGEFLAKTMALAKYVAASKFIEASEKADTRYWSSIPADFRLVDANLADGNYQVFVESLPINASEKIKPTSYSLGKVTLSKGSGIQMLNFRVN